MQMQQWNPQQQQIDPNLPTNQYSYQQMPMSQGSLMAQGGYAPYGIPAPQFMFQGSPQAAQILMKKRPITANRIRNNIGGFGAMTKKASFPPKNPSTMDLEVSRMRPRNIK